VWCRNQDTCIDAVGTEADPASNVDATLDNAEAAVSRHPLRAWRFGSRRLYKYPAEVPHSLHNLLMILRHQIS
jgi:hypothetical protein